MTTRLQAFAGEPSVEVSKGLWYCENRQLYWKDGKTYCPLSASHNGLIGAVRVFEFGASKYARNNWKKGLKVSEIIDSMLRHLLAYQNGEVLDPESGLPHIDHVTCNAIFLGTFGERKEE